MKSYAMVGCGKCIPACPEQAIQIVNTPQGPKARLVKEIYCDGLGACLGVCPTGALTIEKREAQPYDEEATIDRIKKMAPEMLKIHLKHIKEHSQELSKGMTACPSARVMSWPKKKISYKLSTIKLASELRQWPIQLHLVSPSAPYFKNADLILVADCVPFAYPNFHVDFLKGKAIAIGCPKLDDVDVYIEKIEQIIKKSNIKSLKVIHMEVLCCFGLVHIAKEALSKTKKDISFETVIIGIKGEILGKK